MPHNNSESLKYLSDLLEIYRFDSARDNLFVYKTFKYKNKNRAKTPTNTPNKNLSYNNLLEYAEKSKIMQKKYSSCYNIENIITDIVTDIIPKCKSYNNLQEIRKCIISDVDIICNQDQIFDLFFYNLVIKY